MLKNIFLPLLFLVVFVSCNNSSKPIEGNGEYSRREKTTLRQYYVNGERLYIQHCSNCHGQNGEGLARLIPPLKGTDFIERDSLLACIIKNGLQGEIVVDGIMYDQPMPGNFRLTNLEIAELSTYLYKKFFDKDVLVTPPSVEKALNECE